MHISTQPIKEINFTGLHWIEASAGSGKTYNLTSLLTRVLMEKCLPNQVVATTFTRAATAELKIRIRSRLIETFRFFDERRQFTEQENLAYAESIENQDILLSVLLKKFASRVSYACERAKLIIDQLDHLFVGTLDSFSQKLLREFAFESGKIETNAIIDSKKYIQQIIHDSIRNWSEQQEQTVLDLIYSSNMIGSVESYLKLVEDSLNFGSAEVKDTPLSEINLSKFEALLPLLKALQVDQFRDYFDLEGCYFKTVSGVYFKPTSKFNILFTSSLPKLISILESKNYQDYFSKDMEDHRAILEKFASVFSSEKLFTTKCDADAKDRFYNDSGLKNFVQVINEFLNLATALEHAEISLKQFLCSQTKKLLPELLVKKSETTFSQQIRTLLDVLQGPSGLIFADAVQSRYPVIVVDEFQDTNQDQDDILAAIWRNPVRVNESCMIMVGDRKQAIYGFRGGDMLTFVNAFADVQKKGGSFYQLTHNHRSITELVEVVDSLFQKNSDFGDQVSYVPVVAGSRKHSPLVDHHGVNHLPLRWVNIPKGVDAHQQLAWQVSSVLEQGEIGQLYFEENDTHKSVKESDVAILAKGNEDLDKIQYELERLGINVNRPSRRSVFEGIIAQDVSAILTAIMNPSDESKLRRALLSQLIGLDLRSLTEVEKQPDGLGRYIAEFQEVRNLWFQRNFLTGWQYLFETFKIWENVITSKGKDSERSIVNLRHISELLTQNSMVYQGSQSLYQWYLKQVTSPAKRDWELERNLSSDSGVNLMTIHKSKGLEFKVVFLFKADSAIRENQKTLNYSTTKVIDPKTHETKEKRVIGIGGNELFNDHELEQHKQRLEAENRRQWYVALTRASHRLYVFMHDEKRGLNGVGFWKNLEPFEHQYSGDINLLDSACRYSSIPEEPIPVQALDIPQANFYPRQNASFSALAQHLNVQQAQDFLVENYSEQPKNDENHEILSQQIEINNPIYFINKNFVAGVLSGTFLHEIMENIDFTNSEYWGKEIHRKLKNSYSSLYNTMVQKYTELFGETLSQDEIVKKIVADIEAWLKQIVKTKINGDLSLNQLKKGTYLSEMNFFLSMADKVFLADKLHSILSEYGVNIPELNQAHSARYLKGTIDLIYMYNEKYYVADYKSNLLGSSFSDYSSDNINKNMAQSSYFLQAALYMVALHRYLQQRLNNYNPEVHLGGATYLYLRGMDESQNSGVLNWTPSTEMIVKLDQLLGQRIPIC